VHGITCATARNTYSYGRMHDTTAGKTAWLSEDFAHIKTLERLAPDANGSNSGRRSGSGTKETATSKWRAHKKSWMKPHMKSTAATSDMFTNTP
jgi:hypothetical protein